VIGAMTLLASIVLMGVADLVRLPPRSSPSVSLSGS
jgi:hypothetical protein